MKRIMDLVFVACVGWLYLTVLRGTKRPRPVGQRISRPRRRELRKNRYVLPGEW